MTITTRFNKGDKVWVMDNNRPTEKEITSIRIKIEYDSIDVYYKFRIADRSETNEHHVYGTKQDLINSL